MVRIARPGWWLGLVMAVVVFPQATAQTPAPRRGPPPRVELKENIPNPFVAGTTIPFILRPEVCAKGHRPLVSLKIYNVLVQVVAVPVLANDTTVRLGGQPLGCGEYRAYWDGMLQDRLHEATAGVYYYQLVVDGETYTGKMIRQRGVTSRK